MLTFSKLSNMDMLRFASVFFFQNYGDEADAGALVSPTLYSSFGVTEKDFFLARSQEEVCARLFS